MTQKERKLISEAIAHLKSDNGWEDGIHILQKLVNPNYTTLKDILAGAEESPLKLDGPPSTFRAEVPQ